ncbi:MAG: ABC transporter permease [Kofleriaceae bacterium]|jgi:oligopeptide transport system permease protein|nr:ABC transporter permease [Kofleriaceae bacterium]MBP6839544.1 ABC transporter permease [Kofleriaceae bacterium]MBP9207630.1 ABC transporter permease [Kofleriaceae bacterium]
MLRFIFARVGGGILVVLAATTIAFFLLRAAPGGPFDGEAKMSAEVKRNLEKSLQLDKPLYVQYATYITNVVQFDLGQSIKRRQTVNELIAKQFPYSLKLGAFALTFAVLFGVGLGVVAASRRNTRVDYGFMSMALFGLSIPSIVLGPLLQNVFALKLGWLPMARAEGFTSYILPGMTLGLIYAGTIARLSRGSMLEVLGQDYIRTARAKGLSERTVIWKHGLRLGLIPVVTYLGPATAALLSGSFVVERIYQIPGLGHYFISAVGDRDHMLLCGCLVFYVSILVTLNILIDIAYGFLDPRIRGQR